MSYSFFKFRAMGVLTIAVLHDNNTVDIATDRAAGILTLPMLMGERASVNLHIAYMIGLDQKTARLHLLFSLLLSAGLAAAAIF